MAWKEAGRARWLSGAAELAERAGVCRKQAGDLAGGLDQGCVGGGAAMRRVKLAAELRASGRDGEQAMRVIH